MTGSGFFICINDKFEVTGLGLMGYLHTVKRIFYIFIHRSSFKWHSYKKHTVCAHCKKEFLYLYLGQFKVTYRLWTQGVHVLMYIRYC